MAFRATQAKGPSVSPPAGGGGGGTYPPTSPNITPAWFLAGTFAHTAFQIAALTRSIALYTLPALGVIHAVKVQSTVKFAGTGMTAFQVTCGILGELDRYTSAYDVLAVTPGTAEHQLIGLNPPVCEDHSSSSALLITATSDVNLSLSTAGSLYVSLLLSTTY